MDAFQTKFSMPRDKEGKMLKREYTASTKITTIFRQLGKVTDMLCGMPHVEIERIEWQLTGSTIGSLGTESRQMAMQDATRKANDFAGVVGRIPIAIEVYENGGHSYGVVSIDGSVLESENL